MEGNDTKSGEGETLSNRVPDQPECVTNLIACQIF